MTYGERIIRKKELCEILDVSETTLWRLEKKGSFPKRRQLSIRNVGWLLSEVNQWMNELKIADQDAA